MICKTKRFTHSRIRRVVLNSFFGITNDITLSDPPYIRVLGFTHKGKDILRIARKNASLPIVMTVGDVKSQEVFLKDYTPLNAELRIFSI